VTALGVTGHQTIPPDAREFVLTAVQDIPPRRGLTAWRAHMLAAGADQLVATELSRTGARLHVIVPSRNYEQMFAARDDLACFRLLLEAAHAVTRLDYAEPSEEASRRRQERRRQLRGADRGLGREARERERTPDRGVDRPPFPDEIQEANRLAQRLLRARTLGLGRIDKRTPGGRFNGRAYARGRFERATGRPASSHPWTITREITASLEEPHALLVVDTSGSMGAHEYALGPIV
jgi:hypothetical protein